MGRTPSLALVVSLAAFGAFAPWRASAFDVVLNAQGEYLDAYLTETDGIHPAGRYALIVPDDPAYGGRHINGKTCFFPPGAGHDGQFVASDDTYDEVCDATDTPDPNAAGYKSRCDPAKPEYVKNDPAGWAILNKDGSWAGRVIHAEGCGAGGQGGACDLDTASPGTVDPQGCFFDNAGNMWGTDVGHDGDFTNHDGVLVVFFKDSDYHDYCIVADTLLSPSMPAYDGGLLPGIFPSIYLPLSGGGRLDRLIDVPVPGLGFPTSALDCPGHKLAFPRLTIPFTLPRPR